MWNLLLPWREFWSKWKNESRIELSDKNTTELTSNQMCDLHLRLACISTFNPKSLNLKFFGFLYYYYLCVSLTILPHGPEMGKKCQNTHYGLELLFGEPVLLGGPMSGMLFEGHQLFSISPDYFTTPCFTLFQVPSSDRHQLDEASGWNKPDFDSAVPVANELPNPHLLWSLLLAANGD